MKRVRQAFVIFLSLGPMAIIMGTIIGGNAGERLMQAGFAMIVLFVLKISVPLFFLTRRARD